MSLPTIDIKGKEYVLVKDRVLEFNKLYPNGSITTKLISEPGSKIITVKATIIPDCKYMDRKFESHAEEEKGKGHINATSAMENADTSAVGRALAFMGIGVIDSIASVDEINKATNRVPDKPSDKQLKYLETIAKEYDLNGQIGCTLEAMANDMIGRSVKTKDDARELFNALTLEGYIESND